VKILLDDPRLDVDRTEKHVRLHLSHPVMCCVALLPFTEAVCSLTYLPTYVSSIGPSSHPCRLLAR
jgi:hypothetical protein